MNYMLSTRNRKICLELDIFIKDIKINYFVIKGRSDSNYAIGIKTRESLSSLEVLVNSVLVVIRSVR